MKRLIALLGVCCASAFAQEMNSADVGWDDDEPAVEQPAAPATEQPAAPAEQPEVQPSAEQVAQPEPPLEDPAADQAPVPPSPEGNGFVAIPDSAAQPAAAPAQPVAQDDGLQWNFTGGAVAADSSVAGQPAAQSDDGFVAFSVQPTSSAAACAPADDGRKKFSFGIFASGTYNDFYDTKFGFGNIKGGKGYSVKTQGADDLLGNFWGFGYNAGLSMLFMPSEFVGVHLEVGGAYRMASGESDVSVIVTWDDEDRMPEKSDMSLEYYVKQLRIDVPLFVRVAIPNVAFLELGPQASFAIYSKSKTSIEDDFGSQTFREHDVCDLFELDGAIGVGTTKYIGSKALDLSLRFVMGITALNDASDAPKTWQGQFNLTFWFL